MDLVIINIMISLFQSNFFLPAAASGCNHLEDWHQALCWGRQALDADPENYRHQQLLKEIAEKANE
ncbi:MAG: hypothetical protein P1P89_14705 [Desulfobacterales bacterium]|nr:hypothetical protein [Desulfobacterales bacterium]